MISVTKPWPVRCAIIASNVDTIPWIMFRRVLRGLND
jgi:hypothetical protein